MKPRGDNQTVQRTALDLFCGAGGVSMGLHRAGFEVTGVDIKPQPRYPFRFIQADALTFELAGFDFIWASPVCQGYSRTLKIREGHGDAKHWPDMIAPMRERLIGAGIPYVIENVPGAPLRNPLLLCGTMFGLRVIRHRLFESPFLILAPGGHRTHPEGTKSHNGYSKGAHYVLPVPQRGRGSRRRSRGLTGEGAPLTISDLAFVLNL